MIFYTAIIVTILWVLADSNRYYDPHVMPAVFIRWFVFTALGIIICGPILGGSNHDITVRFFQWFAIRGSLFNFADDYT
jgi:hypothetical protein